MTHLIPDSWEMPRHLAGDVIPMSQYRDRDRVTAPDPDWEQGQDAQVIMHPKWKIRRGPAAPAPAAPVVEPQRTPLSQIEPYDPSQHQEPAELYSQDSIDRLEQAGFEPHEVGVWHRPVPGSFGHLIIHDPGFKTSDGTRAPWNLMSDPGEVGQRFRTLSGPAGALAAADALHVETPEEPEQPPRPHLHSVPDDWEA